MIDQEDCSKSREIERRIYKLLDERFERGKMMPFRKISPKLRKWLCENNIRFCLWGASLISKIRCEEWHKRYVERIMPVREGHFGIDYAGKSKLNKGWAEKIYLEIPTDLVEKALALGYLP